MRIATRLVRFDAAPGDPHRPTSTPIHQTATFALGSTDDSAAHDYSRTSNPTRCVLEEQLAALEGARHALAFASGVSAIAAVASLLRAGDEVLAGDDLYGGTQRIFGDVLARRGIGVRHADPTDVAAFASLVSARTRLVHVETPTNPRLAIVDVAALARALQDRVAALGVERPILCVDGTLMTPLLQRPLELGADVVVHSATKALGGHSDVTAGVACTDRDDLARELAFLRNAEGAALAPFEAWLLLRGLKTLPLRLERQQASASRVARALAAHPRVRALRFPGLPDHPGRDIHERQARGPGCVIAFELEDAAAVERFARDLRLFPTAVSFGSVGSSLCHPARMSHASVPLARRREGPPPGLVRLSIGIEDAEDLVADLEAALTERDDFGDPCTAHRQVEAR